MNDTECGFCGYLDYRHRMVDVVEERISAGEDSAEVLADYGWGESEFLRVKAEVEAAGG